MNQNGKAIGKNAKKKPWINEKLRMSKVEESKKIPNYRNKIEILKIKRARNKKLLKLQTMFVVSKFYGQLKRASNWWKIFFLTNKRFASLFNIHVSISFVININLPLVIFTLFINYLQ